MSNSNEKVYVFGEDEISAPADMAVEEVRDTWAEVHPALANATWETAEDTGVTTFRVLGGTKGC